VVAPSDNSTSEHSESSSSRTGEGIVVDIGTGDGRFVYQCARRNPRKFYIGIDPNAQPLRKVSEKIHRRPAKGGLPNALFLRAAIEDLPPELDGAADEIHVHFPWGSLLRALAVPDIAVLSKLRRICAPCAVLEVVIGIDPERDRSEIERLGLKPLDDAYIASALVPRYREAGFEIVETGALPQARWSELHSSWARRLKGSETRSAFYILAEVV
jgi:16S rRNA (adenine(1408)-N(1))-methyltransferase